jgi:hypothetical protein
MSAALIFVQDALAPRVNRMRLRKPKPVRKLAIVLAIKDREVRQFTRFEGSDFVTAA